MATVILAKIPDLQALQWNHRVLLLFAPGPDNALLEQQKKLLDADPKGLAERDVQVFEITTEAADLRSRFGVHREGFAVILIGKDGGSKLKKSEPVALSVFYRKIDSMPMRRSEIKESGRQ